MTTYVSWDEVLEESLRDPEVAAEWERTALARAFAIWILCYRRDHRLTQTAFGKLIGVNQQRASQLEDEDRTPTWDTIHHICKTLKGSVSLSIDQDGKQTINFAW